MDGALGGIALAGAALLSIVTFHSKAQTTPSPISAGAAEAAPQVRVGAVLSNGASARNRIGVALEWSSSEVERATVLTGELHWDPTLLRFLGQELVGDTYTEINDQAAGLGRLTLLSQNPWGLERRVALLAFEVIGAGDTGSVRFAGREVLVDGGMVLTPGAGLIVDQARVNAQVPVPESPVVHSDTWMQRWEARRALPTEESALESQADHGEIVGGPSADAHAVPAEPAMVGDCSVDPCYGDINLDGVVNSADVSAVTSWAAGNCALGICPKADPADPSTPAGSFGFPADVFLRTNVRPANGTELGGPGDSNPPGWEDGCMRRIDATDVSAISNEAAGSDQTIVGDTIPDNAGAHPKCPALHGFDGEDKLNGDGFDRRDQCLSVLVGKDLAYECGDLRIAYPFPAVRTMNKSRTVVWTYNSGHARPYPIIRSQLRHPYNNPLEVRTELQVRLDTTQASWTVVAADTSSGSVTWTTGSLGTISNGFDALDASLETGIYLHRRGRVRIRGHHDHGPWLRRLGSGQPLDQPLLAGRLDRRSRAAAFLGRSASGPMGWRGRKHDDLQA
jgi:hypothetical protein